MGILVVLFFWLLIIGFVVLIPFLVAGILLLVSGIKGFKIKDKKPTKAIVKTVIGAVLIIASIVGITILIVSFSGLAGHSSGPSTKPESSYPLSSEEALNYFKILYYQY